MSCCHPHVILSVAKNLGGGVEDARFFVVSLLRMTCVGGGRERSMRQASASAVRGEPFGFAQDRPVEP